MCPVDGCWRLAMNEISKISEELANGEIRKSPMATVGFPYGLDR